MHLIVLRIVKLLKVSFLTHILIEKLFWLDILRRIFLSLVMNWHLHLLLIFIIILVHVKRLNSVAACIVLWRFRSLDSFISRRLIISKISLLSGSDFIPVRFDLGTKARNMIFFLFLFNENRFLIDLLYCLLVIFIHLCLFLRSIFI